MSSESGKSIPTGRIGHCRHCRHCRLIGNVRHRHPDIPNPVVSGLAHRRGHHRLSPGKGKWGISMAAIALLLSTGCGYQFTVQGPGPVIGEGTGMIAHEPPVRLTIGPFKNNSYEPNLEFKYSRYLRQAMQSAGSAQFVDDGSADLILEGAILSVSLPSLAFSRTQTREARVIVRVQVIVKDRRTGQPLWAQTATSMAPYYIGATAAESNLNGLQFNRVLQDRAIEQAGQLVAIELADRFLWARDEGRFERKAEREISSPTPEISEPPIISENPEDALPRTFSNQ